MTVFTVNVTAGDCYHSGIEQSETIVAWNTTSPSSSFRASGSFFVYGDTLYHMSFMQLQTSGFQTITTVACENKVGAQIVVPSHFVPCYIFYPKKEFINKRLDQ